MCRSLLTVFEEKGYTATGVGSGKEVLKLARRGGLDVILLDECIDELAAVEVCVGLRDDPLFDHATPIVITSSAHATPQSRAAAYSAGEGPAPTSRTETGRLRTGRSPSNSSRVSTSETRR